MDIWRIYYEHWGKQANHLRHNDHLKKCADKIVDVIELVFFGFFVYEVIQPDMSDEDKKKMFLYRYLSTEHSDHPFENIKGDLEKMSYLLLDRYSMNSYHHHTHPIRKRHWQRRFNWIIRRLPLDPQVWTHNNTEHRVDHHIRFFNGYKAHELLLYRHQEQIDTWRSQYHYTTRQENKNLILRVHSTDAIVALF